jgi:hypothetical protein
VLSALYFVFQTKDPLAVQSTKIKAQRTKSNSDCLMASFTMQASFGLLLE